MSPGKGMVVPYYDDSISSTDNSDCSNGPKARLVDFTLRDCHSLRVSFREPDLPQDKQHDQAKNTPVVTAKGSNHQGMRVLLDTNILIHRENDKPVSYTHLRAHETPEH